LLSDKSALSVLRSTRNYDVTIQLCNTSLREWEQRSVILITRLATLNDVVLILSLQLQTHRQLIPATKRQIWHA